MAHHSAMARMEHQALLAAKRQVILEQVEGVGYWSSIQTNQCLPKPYGDLVQGIIAAQTLALLDNTHFALLIYNSASQRCIEELHLHKEIQSVGHLPAQHAGEARCAVVAHSLPAVEAVWFICTARQGECAVPDDCHGRIRLLQAGFQWRGTWVGAAPMPRFCISMGAEWQLAHAGKPGLGGVATTLTRCVSLWHFVSWYACYWGARRAAGVRNAARETCDGLR
ncbi:hypothetical protein ACCO45_005695 [Purpureocillium lilacinum]|uniref:Uncharacterized protein n=1 Tax=Purpureocillium lilacinum TaxID=33203 RepID=A0ACC4DZ80_PURLI